jgi:hypothetical protein
MSRCGDGSLTRSGNGVSQVVTQRCKCAGCEDCGPGYRRDKGKLAASGLPRILITLTAPPNPTITKDEQARRIIAAANAFRRFWNKRNPKRLISWFWVFERHKSGWPHLHILATNAFIPVKLLSVWMRNRMRAKITGVEKIRDPTAAKNYVTKYVSKVLDKFEHLARWGRSRGYGHRPAKQEHFPELADCLWERTETNAKDLIHNMLCRGWRIDPTVKWCAIMRWPP